MSPIRERGPVPMLHPTTGPTGSTSLSRVTGGTSDDPPDGVPDRGRLGERAELGVDGLNAVSEIGSGGSSTVYRARQEALDREVAIKVVHAAWTMETRERFEHERELMGRLSGHTAIVPIFETGITKRGEPYLLMPYYPRGSLFRLMRHRGALPWTEATFLVETLALTLADCHRENIIHRDIKPGNVMLTRHLHPRLADFGIALPLGLTTSPATVAYTPSYSPPEAFEPGTAAPTVDVYGLGATLWALLAGRAPHSDPNPAAGPGSGTAPGAIDPHTIRARALEGPIAPPHADTPAPLIELIQRSMAPDPDARPPDADAFLAELRRATRQSWSIGDPSAHDLPGFARPEHRAPAPERFEPGMPAHPGSSTATGQGVGTGVGAGSGTWPGLDPALGPQGEGRSSGIGDRVQLAAIIVAIVAGLALVAAGARAMLG